MTDTATFTPKLRRMPSHAARLLAAGAVVAASFAGQADAQMIVTDGVSATLVDTNGNITDITTSTVRDGSAFNTFSKFDVDAGKTVNVYQPGSAQRVISVVNGSAASMINGTLNGHIGIPGASTIGGNHFFVNPNGFVVGAGGVINAGNLTLSASSPDFAEDLRDYAGGGVVVGTNPVTALLAGEESLTGGGDIEVYGRINARKLDLRAGARMVLNGNIIVQESNIAPASGTIKPAVNLKGMPVAGGAVLEGGKLRILSKGDMQLRGKITAKRNGSGGLVEAQTEGNLNVSASIDVEGRGNGPLNTDSGSVVLFAEGTAVIEQSTKIEARSVAGDAGFFMLTSEGDATVSGKFDMGVDGSGDVGEIVLRGPNVTVDGTLNTYGGDIAIQAAQTDNPATVTVTTGSVINTRQVADTQPTATPPFTDGDPVNDPLTGASGDLLITGNVINVQSGATLQASAPGADQGGMVALLASDQITRAVWAIDVPTSTATINIDRAVIDGGAIIVNAVARATNTIETLAQEEAMADSPQTAEAKLESFLDEAEVLITNTFNRTVDTVNRILPVQVAVQNATAKVTVTNSTLTAGGNWKNADQFADTTQKADLADSGALTAAGLGREQFTFLNDRNPLIPSPLPTPFDPVDGVVDIAVNLPSAFEATTDSIHIHSHAETVVNISPVSLGLGVAVSVTDTDSRTKITNSALTAATGNINVLSTASETSSITLNPKKAPGAAPSAIKDIALGIIVANRSLTNQLKIGGGSITATDGTIRAAALTGKNHVQSITSNAGKDGKFGLAINLDINTSLTEAAVGGTITARSGFDQDAETLYFAKNHTTAATMGIGSVASAARKNSAAYQQAQAFQKQIRGKSTTGKAPTSTKVSWGGGVAIDLQLDNDRTYASLGGKYRDLDNNETLTEIGPAIVNVSAGAVDVNASTRFAAPVEGGTKLTRNVSAAMGKLTQSLKKEAQKKGISEDQLKGDFENAVMMTVSVSSMVGDTQVEIGAGADIQSAGAVNVGALTRYPNTDIPGDIRALWLDFTDQVSAYSPVGVLNDNPADDIPPAPPDLFAVLNPLAYLTTETKTKSVSPGAGSTDGNTATDNGKPKAEDQKLAIGLSVNYFSTDNTTTAVVRDGATINLPAADVEVTAKSEAFFTHVSNLPKSNPLSGGEKVNDAVGGAIDLARAKNLTTALIENGADITARDLKVDAETKVTQGTLAYSGGSSSNIAINGAIAVNIQESTTRARIGEAADITARDIRVEAHDKSVNWGLSGAISGSENTGIGVSGVVNFATREVYAGIGPATGVAAVTPTADPFISARNVTVFADNQALDIAVSVAGAKVAGGTAEEPEPANNENNEDTIIPSWLFSDDEDDALQDQSNVDTPEDQQGNRRKTGWSVAGAASVNLALGNKTIAEVASPGTIDLTGNLYVAAQNSGVGVTVGGAVAAGLNKTQDTNALAGAFAVHVDTREVHARILDATITANRVDVYAYDRATVANIAVGGAGTSKGNAAVAGSVAVAVLDGATEATLSGTITSVTDTIARSRDDSLTIGVAGAVSVNMSANNGYGVGLGVAVNTVNRSAITRILAGTQITTNAFNATSDANQDIYGFGTSVGVGKTGFAGSVSVNTITGGAKVLIGASTGARTAINATSVAVAARETNTIFSLAGALSGGRAAAIGAAISTNVIVAGTEASLLQTDLRERDAGNMLGLVSVNAASSSDIRSWSVAGAASGNKVAVGAALSVNVITADSSVDLTGLNIGTADTITLSALNGRKIFALGGGVAGSGRGAAGFAATINVIYGNDTLVTLNNASVDSRSNVTATATSNGEIKSAAVAISASGDKASGGAITVNVTTAKTGISANNATLAGETGIILTATDSAAINSLAGGAAFSGGNAVGAAISANFIAHEASIVSNAGSFTTLNGDVTASASNTAKLKSAAIALGASGNNAISGSIAIGDIGNTTKVALTNTSIDAGTGAVTLSTNKSSEIGILSGGAAGGGGNAFGVALTVATIHDGVTSDLATANTVTAGNLAVTAANSAKVEAWAVAGAGGGSNAGAGSLVYTQIGRKTASGPTVDPISGDTGQDPVGDAQTTVKTSRDDGVSALNTALGRNDLQINLNSEDVTRARVQLTDPNASLGDVTITATDSSTTSSRAGAIAIGGSNGGGAALTVNLLLGTTEAELLLPTVTNLADANQIGKIALNTTQTGSMNTWAVAGGGGGTIGGSGSIIVNVMNRRAAARIASSGAGSAVNTGIEDVAVTVTQSGTIDAFAGAVSGGGTGAAGGAIAVNVISDNAAADIENTTLDLRDSAAVAANPLAGAGDVTLTANQTFNVNANSGAGAGAGSGAFAGSFSVNVVDGEVRAKQSGNTLYVGALTQRAKATNTLGVIAGAVAGSGGGSVGVGIGTNVSRSTVTAEALGTTMRAGDAVLLEADANTRMNSLAAAGAVGAVGVTGTAVANSAINTVRARLSGGSDVATRGTAILDARASTIVGLQGGTNRTPSINMSFAGGGTVGVGAAVSVNTTENDVAAIVDGDSSVTGLGYSTAVLNGVARRGVAINAQVSATQNIVTANGAVGGVAGVTALFAFNKISDRARVLIGGAGANNRGTVNALTLASAITELGTGTANAGQDAYLRADISNTLDSFAFTAAIGAKAGAGAAASTSFVDSTAEIALTKSRVYAQDKVTVAARAKTDLETYVAGVGGGFVGVSASANVNRIASQALVSVLGSDIDAGGATGASGSNVTITSDVDNDATTFVGGVAAGAVGAAGAALVNLFESSSFVTVAASGTENSAITASGTATLDATTDLNTSALAISGAGGGFAGAISANVTLAESKTKVEVGANQVVRATGAVTLNANEAINISGTVGSVAVGGVSVGASLDYARFGGSVRVVTGNGARVQSQGNVNLLASSSRAIGSSVVVGSVGGSALAAAVSLASVGATATDSDATTMLGDVNSELNGSQDGTSGNASNDRSSAGKLTAYAGGAGSASTVKAERRGINVLAGASADRIAVEIGGGSRILAGQNLTTTATATTSLKQLGGALSLSASAGVVSGTVVSNVGTTAIVSVGAGANVLADRTITMTASTGGISGRDSGNVITADAATVGASAGIAAGVGVVTAKLSGRAEVSLANTATVGGNSQTLANALNINATRSDTVDAEVYNLTLGLVGGVGAAVVTAENTGVARVRIGTTAATPANVFALNLSALAQDTGRVKAKAVGSTGGIGIALNGVVSTARNNARTEVLFNGANIAATNITVTNDNRARSEATATGVAVGAVAVGASVARSSTNATALTQVNGNIIASNISFVTKVSDASGRNSYASAKSTAGGFLSGSGADARSYLNYNVLTEVGGNIAASNTLTILSDAAGASAQSDASGKLGGAVAIGVVISHAGQGGSGNPISGANVTTRIKDFATIYAGGVGRIEASNSPDIQAYSEAGSGGVLSGSGSEGRLTLNSVTLTEIGRRGTTSTGDAMGVMADDLTISAAHRADLQGKVDSSNASLVGASGADYRTRADAKVDLIFKSNSLVQAGEINISGVNAIKRPRNGWNVQSGSGGALDVAAMVSKVDVYADMNMTFANGAKVQQVSRASDNRPFAMGLFTDIELIDRQRLDSGGAIAIPIGNSDVIVHRNNAIITINNADILATGDLTIYSGGDANLLSEVDTKSYGLAGAASSLTDADYNADHSILIRAGAKVESLGNVTIKSGHGRNGQQTIKVNAESRVYNKTAIPIKTRPNADAFSNVKTQVNVAAGAEVLAVRDVNIFAEAGNQTVRGYGRGKDFYREILAAIGSFFSNLVGGGDLSLDIITGSSTKTQDNGIVVNGLVRAGSRNQQVLYLDAGNNLRNDVLGFSNDLAQDITYTITPNVNAAAQLQQRIDLIQSWLDNTGLNKDPEAVAAWNSEISQLRIRQAAAASEVGDKISLGPILAVEGNINLRSDYVKGAATGLLKAPGDALVKVWIRSDSFLEVGDITIPTAEGGIIRYNDTVVSTPDDIKALSTRKTGPFDFKMESAASSDSPLIEVVTFGENLGTLTVEGDLLNRRGTIRLRSNFGDLDVRGDVSGLDVDLYAGRDFIFGYIPGVRNSGGDPLATYGNQFAFREWLYRNTTELGGSIRNIGGGFGPFGVATVKQQPSTSSIVAGRNVYITADMININGLIQAGRGSYNVKLAAALDTEIAGIRNTKTTGLTTLYNPAEPFVPGVTYRSPHISGDTFVKFNHETQKVEISPMIVQGGNINIVGKVISTGSGILRALDGFGSVIVDSDILTDVVIKRVDLGTSDIVGAGLEGTVRITDTSKLRNGNINDPEPFLTTEYRRIGTQLQEWNTATFDIVTDVYATTDPVTGVVDPEGLKIDRVVPTNLVNVSTAASGRVGTYNPVANRDLIYVKAEETVKEQDITKWTFYIFNDNKIWEATATKPEEVASRSDITSDLGLAPYLGSTLRDGANNPYDYFYAFESRRVSFNVKEEVTKVTNVGGLGFIGGWVAEQRLRTTTTRQLYKHRLKADYGIRIEFDGRDTGFLDLKSKGNLILSDTVLNQSGTSTFTSAQRSVQTASKQVRINTATTTITADDYINGLEGAFRLDQVDGTSLTASANFGIDIREMSGDMNVSSVSALLPVVTDGTAILGKVKLQAEGSILNASAGTAVSGSSIDLLAESGTIGTDAKALTIDTQGGRLVAKANGNAAITEVAGDLLLNRVESQTGNVTLRVPDGSVLDSNDIEQRDIKTEAELFNLWETELGLYGAGLTARGDAQVAALKAEREREFTAYWDARQAAGGAEVTFTLDAATEASLLSDTTLDDGTVVEGWSQAQLDAYKAEREALYTKWNGDYLVWDVSAPPSRTIDYTPDVAEIAAIKDGIEFTQEQLQRSIRDSLVRQTADTQIRIEDPNVIALGDITIEARDSVGELLDPYVLTKKADGDLTAEDLRRISAADAADIVVDTANDEVRITQRDDVNFAFSGVDADGRASGKLRIKTDSAEIFLGSEGAAQIATVDSATDVQIKTDGLMSQAQDGTWAVRGSAILLESGNQDNPLDNPSIGEASAPLTVNVRPGGSVTARAGKDLFLSAPVGDLPLASVFAADNAVLTSVGAITDTIGADVARIIADDITLDGETIATNTAQLGLTINDATNGRVRITSVGDSFVKAHGVLPLEAVRIGKGGRLVATERASLHGADTVQFGTTATLKLEFAKGLGNTASTGTDITGGTLDVTSGGAFGTAAKPLTTGLTQLSYGFTGTDPTPLYVEETDDLRVETVTQGTNAGSQTFIEAAGDMSVGTITSGAEVRLKARNITEARVTGTRVQLNAAESLGVLSALNITSDRFFAEAIAGDAWLQLTGRATEIEEIDVQGAGKTLRLTADIPVTLLAGPGIQTNAGDMTLVTKDVTARADINSTGGNVDLQTTGDFTQVADTKLSSGAGTLKATISDDLVVGTFESLNATATAFDLTVGGTVFRAPNSNEINLVANSVGSQTKLDFGAVDPVGPEGLRTALNDLTALVRTGDLHFKEEDGARLRDIKATGGAIDIFAGGDLTLNTLEAGPGAAMTISSDGSIKGTGTTLSGGGVRLFAFGGALTGETGDTFTGDTASGVTTYFVARDDLRYTELAGDLRTGFALSDRGNLELKTVSGTLTTGILGATGAVTLTANGDLNVNVIGRVQVDLADEDALQLINPERYGRRLARSPRAVTLTARPTNATITAGLINVKRNLTLRADQMDVYAYDATAKDGLRAVVEDPNGSFAENVDIRFIGDGPVLFFADPFASVRPRVAGRLAKTSSSTVTLTRARLGAPSDLDNQITHAGPRFVGKNIIINGDMRFRQRSFDLFAHTVFRSTSTIDDTQIFAVNGGRLSFDIEDEITLITKDTLQLNRKLGGVDLNGGQGFVYEVGVETGIKADPFIRDRRAPGTTGFIFNDDSDELFGLDEEVIKLPLIVASLP
ncbi:leukotoxin LktA family filamentous adhesin [Cognatishimia sp. MH4019]|uniref:leukotoxin LktA family filamentous adhesin n=1 Tax=Cognatishimia sp. MH4019 TaxID=2854030 RepID=UPI001CD3923A|nr:leukotoxin LktA family filamentous adhesin [Cognatishimia sp. MH4019]